MIVVPLTVAVVRKLVGVLTVKVSVVVVAPMVSLAVMVMFWPLIPAPVKVVVAPKVAVSCGVSRKPVVPAWLNPEMSKENVSPGVTNALAAGDQARKAAAATKIICKMVFFMCSNQSLSFVTLIRRMHRLSLRELPRDSSAFLVAARRLMSWLFSVNDNL